MREKEISMTETSFKDQTLGDFLETLASDAPAPGGGAAAALLAAKAAALSEMAVSLTLTNKKFSAVRKRMESYKTILSEARGIFLSLMDEDARLFSKFMEIMQTKATTEEEKKSRAASMQSALEGCCRAPSQTGQTMADLLPLMTDIIKEGNPSVKSDAIIGVEFAISAIRASAMNVRINLKYIKNEFFVREAEETIRTWEEKISAADAVLTYQTDL